jgi:hypothetical protein
LLSPFPFVFCILHYSHATWTVESIFAVHGQTGSSPNLNARCLGPTQ